MTWDQIYDEIFFFSILLTGGFFIPFLCGLGAALVSQQAWSFCLCLLGWLPMQISFILGGDSLDGWNGIQITASSFAPFALGGLVVWRYRKQILEWMDRNRSASPVPDQS